ncbi:MAG: hypothetical protein AB6733_14475 [Clostridiaceae bacterium]
MKRLIIFLSFITCISLMAVGCSKEKIDNSKKESQTIQSTKGKYENEIKEIAYNSLSEENKKTIVNWKEGSVELYKDTNDHPVGSQTGMINIKSKDTYKLTFKTNNEALLGPLTLYLDKSSYELIGCDLRD